MNPGDRIDVMCADGRVRRALITSYPDTFFSQPAKVKVKGKTVTGYVTGTENGPAFRAYRYGKNYPLLSSD